MRENIEKLLNSNINGFYIANQIGISSSIISRLRSGERTIDKLNFITAEKLSDFQEGFVKCEGYTKMYESYFTDFMHKQGELDYDGEKYLSINQNPDSTWYFDILELYYLGDYYVVNNYQIHSLKQKTNDLEDDLHEYETELSEEGIYYVFNSKKEALKKFSEAKEFDEFVTQ